VNAYDLISLTRCKIHANPLKMNSFYYREIPKTLELAIKRLDFALKPLNTVKVE
jgi:hypothetical protein